MIFFLHNIKFHLFFLYYIFTKKTPKEQFIKYLNLINTINDEQMYNWVVNKNLLNVQWSVEIA